MSGISNKAQAAIKRVCNRLGNNWLRYNSDNASTDDYHQLLDVMDKMKIKNLDDVFWIRGLFTGGVITGGIAFTSDGIINRQTSSFDDKDPFFIPYEKLGNIQSAVIELGLIKDEALVINNDFKIYLDYCDRSVFEVFRDAILQISLIVDLEGEKRNGNS